MNVIENFRIFSLCCIVAFASETQAGWLTDLISPSQPKEFKSVQGRFSIVTPVTLKKSVSPSETMLPDGTSLRWDVHSFHSDRGEVGYSVSYNDYPEWFFTLGDPKEISESLLNSFAEGARVANNGIILTHFRISLGNYPGREVSIESKTQGRQYLLKSRCYLVGVRLYIIQVVIPSGAGGINETTAFMDSFKLLGN